MTGKRIEVVELPGPRGGAIEVGWARGDDWDSLVLSVRGNSTWVDLRALDVDVLATLDDILGDLRGQIADIRHRAVMARADGLRNQVSREAAL